MKRYAKFIAASLAGAGVVASSGLLHGTAELILTTCIAVVGAGLVAWVPNAAPKTKLPRV